MFSGIKYFSIFLLLMPDSLFPQAPYQQYNFKHLDVQNGLAQNIVYNFLQDSRGYVWIGTHNGLTMFDGVNAINFKHDEQKPNSLANNFISRIVEDKEQQVWIG